MGILDRLKKGTQARLEQMKKDKAERQKFQAQIKKIRKKAEREAYKEAVEIHAKEIAKKKALEDLRAGKRGGTAGKILKALQNVQQPDLWGDMGSGGGKKSGGLEFGTPDLWGNMGSSKKKSAKKQTSTGNVIINIGTTSKKKKKKKKGKK